MAFIDLNRLKKKTYIHLMYSVKWNNGQRDIKQKTQGYLYLMNNLKNIAYLQP